MKYQSSIQIVLNLIAFLVLFISTGGNGSFWSIFTIEIILCINIWYAYKRKLAGKEVWITKAITYLVLCGMYIQNAGTLRADYIAIIVFALAVFIVAKRKRSAIGYWGQTIALTMCGVLFLMAVYTDPTKFSFYHALFWLVNAISYALLIYEVRKNRLGSQELIIPVFATVTAFLYAVIIMILINGNTT